MATTIAVSPSSVMLYALGDTTRFTATVLDQYGQVLSEATVAYASSDEAVATVDISGLVTAAGNGSATVVATSGVVAGSATVTVEQRVAAVHLSPDSVTLSAVGDTMRLVAEALDPNGHAVVAAEFDWSSDDSVATVDGSGLVTAAGNGSATVTATSGAVGGSAAVTVEQVVAEVHVSPDSVTLFAVGDTMRLVAEALDPNGHAVVAAEFEWSSDDSVATVDAKGLVTAAGNGSATVTATSGAVGGSAAVTVEQVVAEVHVSPDSVTLFAVGDTMRLVAEALDSNGHVVAAEFDWSSDDSVATVDGSGLVTAAGNGSTTVRATSTGAAGSAAVTVDQRVAQVRVSPNSITLFTIGETVRLVAEALDANGYSVSTAEFDWSSDEAVASVDATGLVTAVEDGNATITATSGTVTGSSMVAVRAGYARDREVLVAFFEATGGSDWSNNAGWLSDAPFDDWYGVRANSLGRVVEIVLVENGLEGNLPGELGRLDRLAALSLRATRASAVWCSRTSRPTLTAIEGERNTSASEFTDGAGNPVTRAWSRRDAEGWTHGTDFPVDPTTGTTRSRSNQSQSRSNRLVGRIPAELGDLANLRHLDLAGNELSGPVPPELSGLGKLQILDLYRNELSGALPPELGGLANLELLILGANELSGPLPPALGKLANLRRLDLGYNKFSGSLPPELGKLLSLQELSATCNALTGPLPHELGNLQELRGIHLFGNQLSGEIPASLSQLLRLEEVSLANNYYMTGRIPPSVGGLKNLSELSLASNRFSGPIPAEIGRLVKLTSLNLSNNQLTGAIPRQLGDLTNLGYLALNDNELTGPIPPEFGGLSELDQLSIRNNRLTGPIPPDLGRLRQLNWLTLSGNQLTGPVPQELGNLSILRTLWISGNRGLAGPLPHELTRAPVRSFYWNGTGLCAPRDRAFQSWLAGMASAGPGPNCKLIPREVFAAFYEATGGSSWGMSTNWLTNARVSSWFGVTVRDSLVIGLDLPGNGLSGTLPPEVGDFTDLRSLDVSGNRLAGGLPPDLGELSDLEALDLSDNRFSGPVPFELARLDAIRRLDLSDNELEGALPGALTQLGTLRNFNWNESGACAPEAAWFQSWLASIATRAGPACDAPFVLSVPATNLNQAAQSVGGAVPLIAGRPALLRVFATADRANDYRPATRVALQSEGQEIHAVEVQLGSSRGVPEQVDPGRLDQSYHVLIPGSALSPGVEVVVNVDPDSVMPRASFSEVRVALDVREMPPLQLTIVPVLAESGAGGDVRDWVRGADDPAIEFMRAVLPVGDLDLTVREPLTIANLPVAESSNDWLGLLQDIDLLRTTEGGSGYWYAVVQREGDEGIAGIAYIERRASVGIPDAEVFAHEVGHNMSLRHAPCGRPAQLDPDYPYRDGNIGVYGYDPRADTLVDASTPDLMSYCRPRWISDHNFNKALEYRMEAEAAASAPTAPDLLQGNRLLLWGGVDAEGRLRLDPAFALEAPAKLPSASGPYRVEGFFRDGASAFALDFAMDDASEGGGGFLFLIPFEEERLASLERIVLSGPDGSTALDRQTPMPPMAIVLDQETGRIRSILRGEAAEDTAAVYGPPAPGGPTPPERLLISYGLPSGRDR